jgi:hypothetical protein
MSIDPSEYIPGTCNIGTEEIQQRRTSGYGALLGAIGTYVLFHYIGVSQPFYLLLFFPAMMAALGLLQARARFCVYYGFRQTFNFGAPGGTPEGSVSEPDWVTSDKRKARIIVYQAVIIGLITALVAYFA